MMSPPSSREANAEQSAGFVKDRKVSGGGDVLVMEIMIENKKTRNYKNWLSRS